MTAEKVTVHVRQLATSWQYDFKAPGHKRQRKGGFISEKEALRAGRKQLSRLDAPCSDITLREAFEEYMACKRDMKVRARETYEHHWKRIDPILGDELIRNVTARKLDRLVVALPRKLSMRTVNHHLTLVRAILRHMWKRGELEAIPYVPMGKVEEKDPQWYTEEERDRFLAGIFRQYPQWFAFFYLTCRLGMRRGEVYAISHSRIRRDPAMLVVDRQIRRGTKHLPSAVESRKNKTAYTVHLPQDALDVVDWHVAQGYSGKDFLFSKTGKFSKWLDGHHRPMRTVQEKLGLPVVGHHVIGRHSVGSQAATSGESLMAIQATLGHRSPDSTVRYMHLGSKAQLHVVETLTPKVPVLQVVRDTSCQRRVNEEISVVS